VFDGGVGLVVTNGICNPGGSYPGRCEEYDVVESCLGNYCCDDCDNGQACCDTDGDGICNDVDDCPDGGEDIGCGCNTAPALCSPNTDYPGGCCEDGNGPADDGSYCEYMNCPTIDALGVCGGPCEYDADGDMICDDVDNCVGEYDPYDCGDGTCAEDAPSCISYCDSVYLQCPDFGWSSSADVGNQCYDEADCPFLTCPSCCLYCTGNGTVDPNGSHLLTTTDTITVISWTFIYGSK
jgi:hypothetical protein